MRPWVHTASKHLILHCHYVVCLRSENFRVRPSQPACRVRLHLKRVYLLLQRQSIDWLFYSEVGWILDSKNVLNVRRKVTAVIDDLVDNHTSPERSQGERFLTNLRNQVDIKGVVVNNQTKVNQVANTFAYARFIQVAHCDPRLFLLEPIKKPIYFDQLGFEA